LTIRHTVCCFAF